MFDFKRIQQDTETSARLGQLTTRRGIINTPIFMPVGTLATVKAILPEQLKELGAQIILGNTYHLYLRPGCEVIDCFGGLHEFMHWDRPILTDSGGFQVFSLARLSKISEAGYAFQSHIDGSRHELSPEKSIETQICLNSDIQMCLDQCLPYPSTYDETLAAVDLTTRWAARCHQTWQAKRRPGNYLFGIVQGGMYADLRTRSAQALSELDFPGYAVGGLSVGEPKALMMEMAAHTLPLLPAERPRYVMGMGTPLDIVEMVGMGADMFDCVMPTRNARNGQVFTFNGPVNLNNACHQKDTTPIDPDCGCYTCQHYAKGYLRHLLKSRELLAYTLNTIHNLWFYLNLARLLREAIQNQSYPAFRQQFRQNWLDSVEKKGL